MELFQSVVVSRVTGAWQLKSNLDRLRNSLPRTDHLTEKAEWWRFKNPYIATLLVQLRDTVYDTEDVLAEFDYYELKKKIEGQTSTQLLPSLASFTANLLSNSSTKIKNLQNKLDSVCDELERVLAPLGLPDGPNPYGKAVQRETTSFLPEQLVFGREKHVELVVKLMLQTDADQAEFNSEASGSSSNCAKRRKIANFSILPIVGMGGMGKTTLAQLIYNDRRVESHFDLRIWICVSDYFNIKQITKEMIESANRELATKEFSNHEISNICFGENLSNLDTLQQILKEKLACRRFLLVLDDVWHDNTRDWENLCRPLGFGLEGSMILVTTRMPMIADTIGTLQTINVGALSPDIYWDLFKNCAFGSSDPSSFLELEGIGKKIAARMKGCPLAAKTLGGILRANMTIEHWSNILNSELWQIEQAEGDILPALRVSYQYLPLHLKRCFQTFSLFPKDFELHKSNLAPIWVSDGIINQEDGKGRKYYRDFINRSFFTGSSVHDLMHDLSNSLLLDTFCCLESNNSSLKNHNCIRHLSVYRMPSESVDKEIGRCKNLRSLLLLYELGYGISISSSTLASLFNQITYLRLLQLEACQIEELPHNIGNLKLLIYINISYTKIKSFPDSICQLYNLQVVNAEGCRLKSFPKLFHNLINLRLITCWTEISTKIHMIGKLTFLKELREFKVLKKDGHKIEELKDMIRLQGRLEIRNLENVEGREDAARACLNNKEHLTNLIISWSAGRNTIHVNEDLVIDESTIEGLQPHPNLKRLHIENYGGRTPASWLQTDMLPHLEHLCITGCFNLERLTHWYELHQLSSLQSLEIRYCANLVSLPPERINRSSTTTPTLQNCPQNRCSDNLIFPSNLKCLYLESCGEFDMSLPGSLQYLSSLCELELLNCQHVTSLPSQVTHHIRKLKLSNCQELQCLELSNPSILEDLIITKCPKLIQPHQSTPDSKAPIEQIQNLHQLSIDNTSLLKLPFLRNPPHSLKWFIISNSPEERMFTGELHGWLSRPDELQNLEINGCYNLVSLPEELHTLVTVKVMTLIDCPNIQSLPENGLPTSLVSLVYRGCHPTLIEQLRQHEKAMMERIHIDIKKKKKNYNRGRRTRP